MEEVESEKEERSGGRGEERVKENNKLIGSMACLWNRVIHCDAWCCVRVRLI